MAQRNHAENPGRRSVRQGEIGVGEYPRVNAPSDVSRRGSPLYIAPNRSFRDEFPEGLVSRAVPAAQYEDDEWG
jgi:hypothetical protein